MCGICGEVRLGLRGHPDGVRMETLREMAATIVHRGPDDEGFYLSPDERCGFGFRRLSIVDLARGHQPQSNEDGTVWIVYNGETYNHAELRVELEAKGHRFRTRCDTEVIIHLYEDMGADCVNRLRGMFAFAIWDERAQTLLLARDRLGIKPLYWTRLRRGGLRFASEIKALLAPNDIRPQMDLRSLYDYLTFLVAPAPRTMFDGISKLPAGHTMTVDANGRETVRQYWDAVVETQYGKPDEWYSEQVRALLRESVHLRMMSDVPFGAFLSGGLDSTTNVALMTEVMDHPADTFSVGFQEHTGLNEFSEAQQAAMQFRTSHHEICIDDNDMLRLLPRLIYHQDEPLADPVCVPLFYVAQLTRQSKVIVGHVGEGSDELFFGYNGYWQTLRLYRKLWRHAARIPGPLRGLGQRAILPVMNEVARRHRYGRYMRDYSERLLSSQELFWGGNVAVTDRLKHELLGPALRPIAKGWSSHSVVQEIYDAYAAKKPDADFIQRMIYIELKLRLPELLLMRVDKMTMANSIEARVPFLDHKLVEFALSIPSEVLVRDGQKSVLKRAVRGIIPDWVIDRKKMGFGGPTTQWFRGVLREPIRGVFAESRLLREGVLELAPILRLLDDHQAERTDYGMPLWALLNVVLWYERWCEGSDATLQRLSGASG